MVIIEMVSYPTESVKEMVKRFMELPPLPSYITRKGPYISSELGVGIRGINLYEFDQSKMAEAIQFISSVDARFFGVPGFTHSIRTWLEVNEALKAAGMSEKPKGK